jgi:hypothetical protein
MLSNIFAGDLLDQDYWTSFPRLRHLTVSIRGHNGCTDHNSYLSDHRLFTLSHLNHARKVWRHNPSFEPLEHFNMESF